MFIVGEAFSHSTGGPPWHSSCEDDVDIKECICVE
jgi:hypothetical protein